jgi:hypothetical protein
MSQFVAILLRKTSAVNRFRQIILRAINDNSFDEFLICSGFFQENIHYRASNSFTFTRTTPCRLTTVGVYNWLWKAQYDSFVAEMRKKTTRAGAHIPVTSLRIPRFHWHAKVFIAKSNGIAKLGIIGSSNITRRAFDTDKRFNHECDVVLWIDSNIAASGAVRSSLESLDNPAEVILAGYNPDDPINRSLTLPKRLLDLEEEIRKISSK